MKTMSRPEDRDSILARLKNLSPADRPGWGVMSVNQMLCHLDDSYKIALGTRTAGTARGPLPGPALKWLALKTPFRWQKSFPTLPEVEQGKGGTTPIGFHQDQTSLLDTISHFCDPLTPTHGSHPIFGPMSKVDWMRWGYLHADHHLRQFGR